MRIQESQVSELDTLAASIDESMTDREDFGAALLAVQQFVEQVIFDPASVTKVFASLELDMLCKAVALRSTLR